MRHTNKQQSDPLVEWNCEELQHSKEIYTLFFYKQCFFSAQAKVLLKNLKKIVSDVASVLLISVIFLPIIMTNLETWKWINSEINSQNHFLLFLTFITHLYNEYCSKTALFPLTLYLGIIVNAWNVRFKKFRLLLNDMVTISAWGCCLACAKFLAIFSLVLLIKVLLIKRKGCIPRTSPMSAKQG